MKLVIVILEGGQKQCQPLLLPVGAAAVAVTAARGLHIATPRECTLGRRRGPDS